MQDPLELKKKLFTLCENYITERIGTIKEAMNMAQDSANQQEKSSAGDKHETSRSLMQLEQEKCAKQLAETQKLKQALVQIKLNETCNQVKLGAVVLCAETNFFIAISMGKIRVDEKDFFAISPTSPIGQNLAGLKKGDTYKFNGKEHQIKDLF